MLPEKNVDLSVSGGGGDLGWGGHMYTCGRLMSMYGKNHNIVK